MGFKPRQGKLALIINNASIIYLKTILKFGWLKVEKFGIGLCPFLACLKFTSSKRPMKERKFRQENEDNTRNGIRKA